MSGCDHKWADIDGHEVCEKCHIGAEGIREKMLDAFKKAVEEKLRATPAHAANKSA